MEDSELRGAVESGPYQDAEDPRELVEEIAQILIESSPPDCTSAHAVFSLAGDQEIVDAVAVTPGGVAVLSVAPAAVQWAWAHRELTMDEQGPWLRLLIDVERDGTLTVGFDYGENAMPPGHRLPAEAYLADFERYPHADPALWLLAHMANEGQQIRTAGQAAAGEADGVGANVSPRQADAQIPPLSDLWSRMAALAAVSHGSNAVHGPRIDTAFCVYRGVHGSCLLARLPHGRAVLSGGTDDSELLIAAYRGEITFPSLYRGAPSWVHHYYLDERAAAGLLSFCYWWDGGHWYGADIADAPEQWSSADEITSLIPDMFSAAGTADQILAVLASIEADEVSEISAAVVDFVQAVESGAASHRHVQRLFPGGVPEEFDVAEAVAQLDAAGALPRS